MRLVLSEKNPTRKNSTGKIPQQNCPQVKVPPENIQIGKNHNRKNLLGKNPLSLFFSVQFYRFFELLLPSFYVIFRKLFHSKLIFSLTGFSSAALRNLVILKHFSLRAFNYYVFTQGIGERSIERERLRTGGGGCHINVNVHIQLFLFECLVHKLLTIVIRFFVSTCHA